MHPLLPFVAFAVAFAVLIVWLIVRGRAERAERARQLGQMGFAPCPSEAAALAEKVSLLENNSGYRYRVCDPMQAALGDRSVFFYTKERRRSGSIMASHELLLPLARPSADGLLLFFKPSSLRAGTTVTAIGRIATTGWESQPDDLTALDIPIDLQQSNLIGALAPAGASLWDLIDSKALAQLQPVADYGATVVTCRGAWCSLSSGTTRAALDLSRLWSLAQQLAGSR